MVKNSIVLVFVLFVANLHAQTVRHVVYLKDKKQNSFTLSQPEAYLSARSIERRTKQSIVLDSTDLPVSDVYFNGIKAKGAKIIYPFKWLNAILIEANPSQILEIANLSYVKNITSYNTSLSTYSTSRKLKKTEVLSNARSSITDAYYGDAFAQIDMLGIKQMHQAGFKGQGVLISVFDNGFENINTHKAFDSLFSNNRVKATFDLADGGTNVYNDGSHGTNVLSCIAACEVGKMVSGAYKASFHLFRTEVDAEETPLEMFYWLKAAELSDSLGTDIISSSLGYNTFDDNSYDYTYSDMDGETTVISKAANFAFAKGMIIVNSAGNEGLKDWHYLTAPSDAIGVLSAGAVDFNENYASFSSAGPSSDDRIKPDLASPGVFCVVAIPEGSYSTSSGTSFAAPNLTALVAGFWQAFPSYDNKKVVDVLRKSGSQASNPDNLSGYGIPRFDVASNIALGIVDETLLSNEIRLAPNPVKNEDLYLILANKKVGSSYNFTLFDLQGKLILQQELNNIVNDREKVLNCSLLASGLYILKIIDESGNIKSFKLVKD